MNLANGSMTKLFQKPMWPTFIPFCPFHTYKAYLNTLTFFYPPCEFDLIPQPQWRRILPSCYVFWVFLTQCNTCRLEHSASEGKAWAEVHAEELLWELEDERWATQHSRVWSGAWRMHWIYKEICPIYSVRRGLTVGDGGVHSCDLKKDGRDAWIFDIDDTLLSTVPYYKKHNHG